MSEVEHPNEQPSIWDLYNKHAKKRDEYLVDEWNSGIGSLLIFAGIFAAAVTSLCVETRKMLEEDPQVSTRTILLAMAAKMNNDSLSAVPSLEFTPEPWAVQVNYLLFISLTSSLVASLGGIICLQWIGGYTDGLETHGDAKLRALHRHSRYKAAKKWRMLHFIVGLHLLLFCAVIFFLAGLALWFWHTHPHLATIPFTGLVLWVVGYLLTTILAAVHPYAPYRNSISRFLFRFFSMLNYWIRTSLSILPCATTAFSKVIYQCLQDFRQIPREWMGISSAWKKFREEYRLYRTLAIQSFVKEVATGYPWEAAWMASSSTYWMAMHSNLWELGRVNQDDALPLSTLAWLARKLGQPRDATNNLTLLLKELSRLEPIYLKKWKTSHFDAPWMQIINLLLGHPIDHETRDAIADVLLKMSNNSTLFKRFAGDMGRHTVEFFLQQLDAHPLRNQISYSSIRHYEVCDDNADAEAYEQAIISEAENRLTSLTAVLASNLWITERHPVVTDKKLQSSNPCIDPVSKVKTVTQRPPSELIPGILLDALERCNVVSPTDATTLWVFTIYTTDPLANNAPKLIEQGEISPQSRKNENNSQGIRWPNPLIYNFQWHAFGKPSLRIQAIAHYFAFLELYLYNHQIDIPGMKLQWQVPDRRSETTKKLMEILTHHLLRLHAHSQIRPLPNDPSISLLVDLQSKLLSPSLRLICSVIDLKGLLGEVKILKPEDEVFPDSGITAKTSDTWKQAVMFWCGIRPGWDKEACALQEVNEEIIQKAVLLFETVAIQDDWHLNNAAEELIYRLAPHLEIHHWVQFIAVFFPNGLCGNPSIVVSRVVRLLLRLSPTSASDHLREIIYKKMIQPARIAESNPLKLQMKRVCAEGTSEGKLGVKEWYQLVNEYSKRRRMKEVGSHIKLRFKLDRLLQHIQECIRPGPGVMELETSYFRGLMVIYKATAYQYLRLAERQQRLEENTLRHMPGRPKRGVDRKGSILPGLKTEPIQSHKEENITIVTIDQVIEAEEPIVDKRSANLRLLDGIGIRRKLNQHLEVLKSIQNSFGTVEENLRKIREDTLDPELAGQDSGQIDLQEIPSTDTALKGKIVTVKDISKLVETDWRGWVTLFKGIGIEELKFK